MSFILEDDAGRDLQIQNAYWAVFHLAIERSGIFPEELVGPLGANLATELTPDRVQQLCELIEQELLPQLSQGERFQADLTLTEAPMPEELDRENPAANYGLTKHVLTLLLEFFRASQGTVTVY